MANVIYISKENFIWKKELPKKIRGSIRKQIPYYSLKTIMLNKRKDTLISLGLFYRKKSKIMELRGSVRNAYN